MSEELYFFKFNRENARANLAPLIDLDENLSFKKYLLENPSNDEELIFENIKNKIDENVDLLSSEELWCLFNWFYYVTEFSNVSLNYSDWKNKMIQEMSFNGLDLFYEIGSKTPVRKFHSILNDYETLTQRDLKYKSSCAELSAALDYVICFTGELTLFLQKYYYKEPDDSEENRGIRKLIFDINSESGNYYHQLALSELATLEEYNKKTMEMTPKLSEFRRANKNESSYTIPRDLMEAHNRESEIIDFAAILYHATEIKKKLSGYNGQITRLHSF